MKQRIKYVSGKDFESCADQIEITTKDQNKDGFELIDVYHQCQNNNPYQTTEAILVFNKK